MWLNSRCSPFLAVGAPLLVKCTPPKKPNDMLSSPVTFSDQYVPYRPLVVVATPITMWPPVFMNKSDVACSYGLSGPQSFPPYRILQIFQEELFWAPREMTFCAKTANSCCWRRRRHQQRRWSSWSWQKTLAKSLVLLTRGLMEVMFLFQDMVILRAEKRRLIIREVQHSGHYTWLVHRTTTSVRQGAFNHASWNMGLTFAFEAPECASGYFTKLRNFGMEKPRSALDRQSYCVFPRKIRLLPMKGDRPGLTSGVMFLIVFGSFSGSFVEDTLKKEKQGFSSSYATDTGLKSDANGKSLFFWKCNRISPASITTFPFQAHTLNFVMHRKTGKTSFTVVKTGGLKSMPKRDKETYAGKRRNSDFHWKKHQSTMYKKAIVLEGHEWSLSNEPEGGDVQELTREIGTNDFIVDE